jgi:CheY-like chemotaxis protein
MARVPSVAQTEQTFRPVAFVVRKLLVAGRCCPNCGSPEIRPSNRRNALDVLVACVFLAPFRCRVCRDRFYRVWRPSLQRPADPPIAPLVLVPVQNKLLNLDSIEPPRHEPEPIHPRNGEPPSVQLPRSEIEPRGVEVAEPEPVESTPATAQELPSPEEPRPASAHGPILILEDDLSIRKLLRRQLDRRGYLTVEVLHADDLAVELLGRSASLLIVDVSAARAPGIEAVVALALAHPRLKILALSAESVHGSEIPGRLVALPKPFPLDSFVDCVERLLAEPRA